MTDTYVQCVLRKCVASTGVGHGYTQTTTYIPTKFAKVGKHLRLKNEHDVWTDGWVVLSVGYERITSVQADTLRGAWKDFYEVLK